MSNGTAERVTYAWIDDALPPRRRTRREIDHAPEFVPRIIHTDVPVPAEETPCARYPEAFFSEERGATRLYKANRSLARTLCGNCWMIQPCRAYALEHEPDFGIWGGWTPAERSAYKGRHGRGR